MADGYSSEELFDSLTPIRTTCSSNDEDSPIPLKPLDMSVLFAAKEKGVKRAYTFRKASSAPPRRGADAFSAEFPLNHKSIYVPQYLLHQTGF